MARISKNSLMYGIRGMLGGQVVVKVRNGKPYLAGPPSVNPRRKPGKNEKLNRERFKRSNAYASHVIQYPEVKLMYGAAAAAHQTAHNVAFSDAFHGPEILAVLTHGYFGAVNNAIIIQARDNFKVDTVGVSIFNENDVLIEQGLAVDNNDGLNWIYTITVAALGSKIVVTAYDLPGNKTEKKIFLRRSLTLAAEPLGSG